LAGFDYQVPRGARLVLSTFLVNRSPDLYPQPDRCDLARWSALNPSVFKYPVFGGASRNCPGHNFALVVSRLRWPRS
jgi:cytochrome P450